MPVWWGQSTKFRVQSAKCSFCPRYSFLCHPGTWPRDPGYGTCRNATHIAFTGSPRSRCSLAMTRYTTPCHCERSEAIQSVVLSRSDPYFLFNSAFAGANKFDHLDPVVKMHPTKTFVFAGAPRTRMTKRIQSTKNPHMIIFSLQDMWQTNKINTKHVPNPNHRLD